ncbi:hypothetical protein PJI23_32640, partial [Mycobacterium kansasii]
SGWSAARDEILKASAARILAFEDEQVKAQSLPPASMEPYNSVLASLFEHLAVTAGISPSQISGKMVNVSADALAAAEKTQQRKL